jgi:hypothetical protein
MKTSQLDKLVEKTQNKINNSQLKTKVLNISLLKFDYFKNVSMFLNFFFLVKEKSEYLFLDRVLVILLYLLNILISIKKVSFRK